MEGGHCKQVNRVLRLIWPSHLAVWSSQGHIVQKDSVVCISLNKIIGMQMGRFHCLYLL